MRTIYKYQLAASDSQGVAMPSGAQALYAAEQQGSIVLYALVNPSAALVSRTVHVVGTGHPADRVVFCQALGVVSLLGGQLMFHVFIEPEEDL